MKTDCDVIRDLMPLAAEGIASEKSLALVREHLEECPACRAAYEEMKKEEIHPLRSVQPLDGLRKRIRRHELTIGALLAALVLTPLFIIWGRFYLSPGDEMGYAIIAFYIVIPGAAFFFSIAAGMGDKWMKWLLPVVFGLCNDLIPLLVFGGHDWFFFAMAAVLSLLGLTVGLVIKGIRKWIRKKKTQKAEGGTSHE